MTDAPTDTGLDLPRRPSREETEKRIRRRYRAERRFKAYGLGALLITTFFVVVLLLDIFIKGFPAFWQHSVALDVDIKSELVDPTGKKDVQSLRAADYFPLVREAIMAAVPGVTGRPAERTLARLLSIGAPDTIRDRVVADPSIIGSRQRLPLALSSDADLYLKSGRAMVSSRAAAAPAKVSVAGQDIVIETAGGDFDTLLAETRMLLRREAAALRTEITRLKRGSGDSVRERIAELTGQADIFDARGATNGKEVELDNTLPSVLVETNGGLVKIRKFSAQRAEGNAILPLAEEGDVEAGKWSLVRYGTPESRRKNSDLEVAFVEKLAKSGRVENKFNTLFFTAGDSREPELAGIRGALVGSFLTLAVTLLLCVPIGVMAAIYLEEFAPKNRLTTIIEVNINNLAAVPSIVFGLLGLAVFLNFFGMSRSAPVVGGLVLALLVLPTIIIASRAALKAVPPSIKEAAVGVGASHQQAVFHHVLPLAMPGIMTGTIIGMAHALGETAPLLMIGMVAFIVDVPGGILDAATVMPVQIYLWSDLPEQAFKAKTAGAIVVLLGFLFLMNGTAIWLRKRFERRW